MEAAAGYENGLLAVIRCTGPFEGQVQVFDLSARRQVSVFPVIYYFGTKRFAVQSDFKKCFVGCDEKFGLAAYSMPDGAELWRRKDLNAVGCVVSLTSENAVFCRCGDNEAFFICSNTGKTLEIQHGVHNLYTSPFSPAVIVGARDLELHSSLGKRVARIPRTTFATLDCAFSQSEVVISEAGGPVRCYDLNSFELLWTHTPAKGSHFLRLCYAQSLDCFVCVYRQFEGPETVPHQIHHLARRSDEVRKIVQLENDALFEFCLAGKGLFLNNLLLLSTETGKILYDFDPNGPPC